MAGVVPPLDPRPLRSMADMGMGGMDHGAMGGMKMDQGSMAGMQHGTAKAESMPAMPGMDHSKMPGMDHSSMPRMGSMAPGNGMPMNHGAMKMDGMKMD